MMAWISGAIILCYLTAFAVVEHVVAPIQASVATRDPVASFMFLPHGIRAGTCNIKLRLPVSD